MNADLTIPSKVARAVAYKTTNFGECAQKVDGRKQVTRCKRHQLHATVDEKRVSTDNKRLRSILHERSKGGFDFVIGSGLENVDVLPGGRRGAFKVLDLRRAGTGLVGLTRRAIRVARGTISCSTPSRLAPSSDAMKLMPVIFPPGWLRLATMPAFTGSVPAEKTIGI